MSEENEDPTRSFMTRVAYDKEQNWEDNKQKLEFPGYSYVRHTSNEYISGVRNASDGYAHSAMQINISDLKGAMGEGSDYDDTAIKRELEKQGKAIETNTDAIADKSDSDHTHSEITDPYDDSWIQPEIDTKSDKGHTHDISHDHDTEYQPVGEYADKNHLHNFDHTHDDYLTSDDLPDPYDDTQIRDDFAAADQNLQDQITIINDKGYDDSGIKLSIALEEEARIAGDDALSGRIDGKADDGHTHDPIDITHNHNSQYQPIGDYATKTDLDGKSDTTHSHPPQETTHDHNAEYQPIGNYADKDHGHPPQDLTHDHNAEYAPIHEHPYSDKDHTHPPQDLTHNHDSDYQPVGDYATNKTVVDGDQDLQDQIDAISSGGEYNDSWIEPAINTGDANTLQGAKQYTNEEVAKIFVPDVSDFATTNYVDAGDAAVEAKIPDVSNFATNQELTDGLASKSDTTHDHDEFTHTHDFTHDHDGQYALEHDHPYAPTTHDHLHDHSEYFPNGNAVDDDGNPLPLPYPDANSLGMAVNGKADEHGHPYVKSNADTSITPTADNRFITLKNQRPKEEDGSYADKEFGLAIDIDEGNTWKNQFEVGNRNGFALKVMGGGGRTTWFGGKITQKGDSLENADDRDYIIRKNLTDAISELSDKYASEGHNHEEYFPFGDWSDSEFEPHADLRAWDDAWMEMFDFYDKAQKITDRIQNTRLDALEEQNVSLLSKIEELEGRIEELEVFNYGIALGTFTLNADNGRPTGPTQTIGVAGIWHSKVADATTSPNNEIKANNGDDVIINHLVSHEGPITLRIIQANGNKQTWACESSGWITDTNVIHISSNEISGDDLNPDEEVRIFVELL